MPPHTTPPRATSYMLALRQVLAQRAPTVYAVAALSASAVTTTTDEDEDEAPVTPKHPLPLSAPPPPPLHWPHLVAATGAGIITAVFTSPMDVIRTRLAVQENTTRYRGLIGSAKTTFAEEGARGLYRGFGATIVVVPLFWAIYFTSYAKLKEVLHEDSPPSVRGLPTWTKYLVAACSAGAVADIIVNPLFVVRTRMQTQHMRMFAPASNPSAISRPLYTGTINTMTRMVREEGAASLMRGVSASLLGLSHVCVQFPLYEALKIALPASSQAADKGEERWPAVRVAMAAAGWTRPAPGTVAASSSPSSSSSSSHHVEPNMWHLIAASSVSKMIASVATFPHEVLRSRLQNAPKSVFAGLRDCATKTVQREGFSALYKGLGVNLVRTVPGCVLTFVSYELLLKKIHERYGHPHGHRH